MISVLNGGPAFPTAGPGPQATGMSLLDYFAGQALPAVIAAAFNGAKSTKGGAITEALIASQAYDLGAAMLQERKRRAAERHKALNPSSNGE